MLLKKRYKHFNRLRFIANTFARHGFGYLIDSLGLKDILSVPRRFDSGESAHRLTRGERVRKVFEELGPTFIKLGQVLSTRSDFLPKDIIVELEKLQDHTPPVEYKQVNGVILEELGADASELFLWLEEEPLASASIGQVHQARLTSGERVVVKVQRPNLKDSVETDLEILFDLARIADRRTAWGERYSLTELVDEFSRTITAEMDFRVEGKNADRFQDNFYRDSRVYIPRVYWDYTTSRVLTMEQISGIKLSCLDELDRKGYDRSKLAGNFSRIMLKQILLDGFFHADPHPGNVFVLEGGVFGFLDFGMVGNLTRQRMAQLAKLLVALAGRNSEALLFGLLDMGIAPQDINRRDLKADIDRMWEKYLDKPVNEIKVGAAFNELLDLTFKYRIKMPPEFIMLSKSLIITEGVVRVLDPDLSVMGVVGPFARTLIRRQFSPGNMRRVMQSTITEYAYIISELPRLLRGLRERVEQHEVRAVLRHEGMERGLSKLDQIANRLSFSIVLLAFSILMAGLVVASAVGSRTNRIILDFPIIEAGFIVGGLLFLWLIFSIIRSGRF